ncbi:hypothetical protein NDN08_002811 [Rhodosorus marinus]|uniref:Uncharacterized protein n=1 Tax=Rhodosorus marinus TaxID=101924 RepID=A0AAV8UUT8_9RHOD|nr:hypothetical protein NDN08_002811 [Rhodosorus marinus]
MSSFVMSTGSIAVVKPSNRSLERASFAWGNVAKRAPPFDVRIVVGSREQNLKENPEAREGFGCAIEYCGGKEQLLDVTLEAAEWMRQEFQTRLSETNQKKDLELRLALIRRTQCPKLHFDKVPLRALATLVGPSTMWAQEETVDWVKFNDLQKLDFPMEHLEYESVVAPKGLTATPDFHALFLSPPAMHRSPHTSDTRVLLQCDLR